MRIHTIPGDDGLLLIQASDLGTLGFAAGFALMMVLDVVLG